MRRKLVSERSRERSHPVASVASLFVPLVKQNINGTLRAEFRSSPDHNPRREFFGCHTVVGSSFVGYPASCSATA